MKVLALDFETSGLDPKRHFPVSLGVALMDGEEVLDSREWTIKPPYKDGRVTREYDVFALKVSGKTLKDLDAGMTAQQVGTELLNWSTKNGSRDLAVLAFNAPFDLSFYSELLFAAGGWNQHLRRFEAFVPPLFGPWQCVRLLALNTVKLESYSLDKVAAHFGLSRASSSHGALEDAILAGRVYHRLTSEQVERGVA